MPPSVIVSGFVDDGLGIGAAARGYAAALTAAGCDVALHAIEVPGRPAAPVQHAETLGLPRVDAGASADVVVCAVHPPEIAHFRSQGVAFPVGRVTIGAWVYEVDPLPPIWRPESAHVDEVWTPSPYAAELLQRGLDAPVVSQPPPLQLERRRDAWRPGGPVLVVGDACSSLVRKNPLGAIEAYRAAVGPEDGHRLLVKVWNGDQASDELALLHAAAAGRPDIEVVDRFLARDDYVELLRSSTCLLSLHRAEGFGIVLFEALALGVPVVCTEGTGPAALLDGLATLVAAHSADVPEGVEQYAAGSTWLEPDLDDAAEKLATVLADPLAARPSAAAADRVVDLLSVDTIGATLAARLERLVTSRGPGRRTRRKPWSSERRKLPSSSVRVDPGSGVVLLDDDVLGRTTNERSEQLRADEAARTPDGILLPLRLDDAPRVLHVGCGDGRLTRAIAEAGCEVVGIDDDLGNARLAAQTCAGLDVQLLCGPITALPERDFDLIVARAPNRPIAEAAAALERLRGHLADEGSIALVATNRLAFEHLVAPASLALRSTDPDGSSEVAGEHRWSRHEILRLLDAAEIGGGRRLFHLFADADAQEVIVADEVYDRSDGESLVSTFVRQPRDASPAAAGDARGAQAVLLESGLGREIAGSFLVVAGEGADDRCDDALIWLDSSARLPHWRRRRVARDVGACVWIRNVAVDEPRPETIVGWLRRRDLAVERVWPGPVLEDVILDSLARNDLDEMTQVLRRYYAFVRDRAKEHGGPRGSSPWVLPDTTTILDEYDLDLLPRNLVTDESGDLRFVDDEWGITGGVDVELVLFRAAWILAHAIVSGGLVQAWPAAVTVDQLADSLGELLGHTWRRDLLDDWRSAEAALQSHITGAPVEDVVESLRTAGASSAITSPARPSSGAVNDARLTATLSELDGELRRARAIAAERTAKVEGQRAQLLTLRDELIGADARAGQQRARALRAEADRLQVELERDALLEEVEYLRVLARHRDDMYSSTTWRLGRAVTAPARAVKRILRRRV